MNRAVDGRIKEEEEDEEEGEGEGEGEGGGPGLPGVRPVPLGAYARDLSKCAVLTARVVGNKNKLSDLTPHPSLNL